MFKWSELIPILKGITIGKEPFEMRKIESISVVIPVKNESESIAKLHFEITEILHELAIPFEIIIIDDGSSDSTREVVRSLVNVRLIQLARNFGQTAAMAAGIQSSTGQVITFLDGDGQNDPRDIPNLMKAYQESELDIICGWRKNRKDSAMKRLLSSGARTLRRIFFQDEIHDSGCTLKLMNSENAKKLQLYGELHRFIPQIAKNLGMSIGEIVVTHRPRVQGSTKYNWKRIFKGYLDIIALSFWSRYSTRPLHVFGSIGVIFFFIGNVAIILWIYLFYIGSSFLKFSMPSLILLLFIASLQFILFGLLADKLVKDNLEFNPDKKSYIIKSIENY
jgi:glycosyltransferase involved in cell wall biosynthesis